MTIRKVASLVVALAVSSALAAPAFAVTVSRADGNPMNPNGEPFSATGGTTLTKGTIVANCLATFNGTITSSGIVTITSTTFTPASSALCGLIQGSATSTNPWTGQADTATQLTINNAQVNASILGTCGPSQVVTTWNNGGSSLTFNNAVLTPNCSVSGTVTTSPKLLVQ
ncbi:MULTISPECIES: hypothetical protein [unclassified Burkholderia]|uniref:hypothetical protein n=1 Tax=unclassified Burkholderia TaxID=2613784 RepID=UPI001421CB77|nr:MULTISPECIES: hypothetical protein [unclassified Burkholderia]NIE84182.1 hypothetical protein [Burkholderia sp. Tr-860]NIF62710.1 hypothetical protein [Burkholderia sp. Cy-647]NIF71219.1 hypothetical protein [Burkholderia sp. Ap-962]NIF89191.1 hypothetical protein [Burkholderia sp. Cy-637]NIF96932.1 hypothetical protein [Burkholderia sp. Ax-1720]